MAEQYINMDNLAVGYNGKALIHDICIGIEKGEIVTLIEWCRQIYDPQKYHTPAQDHFWKCDDCRCKPFKAVFP